MQPAKCNRPLPRRLACSTLFGFFLLASVGQQELWSKAQSHEDEAEPKISLSAATISDILRREPGLLLEVKRVLVRKAYEQGRLLDPADLTDDALYQLLRVDDNVRILATQEIEKREYVRAKPTRQEMENDKIRRLPATDAAKSSGSPLAQSEEEKYWARHDQTLRPQKATSTAADSTAEDEPANNHLSTGRSTEGSNEDESEPVPSVPLLNQSPRPPIAPASPDYNRRQSLAGLEPQNQDFYDAMPPEAGSLPRIGPESMPGLLSASMDRSSTFGPASESKAARSFAVPPSSFSSLSPHLDTRRRRPLYSPPEDEDRPVIRHRTNPYAGVPSLYDLYAQVSRHSPVLARFGEDIFRNGTGNFDELPMDLPVGPDYVLGPGDGLSIELWGGVSQHLQRVVDREGRVALPEAGAVQVNGRSVGDVQQLVQSVLRSEFRDVHADVSLARLRTVRVYVVGDVLCPGAYDVSSLSTPLNALYQAGGPTSRGSLRILRLNRGQQLVAEIDVYDLLLHGVHSRQERLQAGDTIMVPPMGAALTVEGMVRRPAIYELNHESNLAEALQLAGGVLNTGTFRHIEVERIVAHESRSMLRLDLPENNNQELITGALEDFKIQDGDKIRISPILPYSEQTVYLDGHVFHPGKHAYREGMRVSDLIHSYSDLLPEPASRHAEVIRLAPPDYAPQVIAFNLADALGDKGTEEKSNVQNVTLKAFDTVRIFGRYDFEDPPTIMVSGEVRNPGEHVTNGETHLRDAVYLAGGVTRDALLADAQVFRRTADGKLMVLSVNLERALAGDASDNVPLEPKDRVFIHRNLSKVDPPAVKIEGEVARPGKYPLGDDMSAAQLVRLAGGLKRGAFTEAADLTRYTVENGAQVMGEHVAVPIAHALAGDADTDVRLHDGDVLTIRQLAGWNDVGSVITVKGEVMHPGDYGIQEGERLSAVLKRAGGFRADAYPYGAILERRQVRELEEKNHADLIRQVQAQQSTLKLIPDAGDADEKLAKDAVIGQWHATLDELKTTPPQGRLVIHISKNAAKWANTPADVEVRAGDTLLIPKTPTYVMVNGQVYNPTAITYHPGRSAGWYLRQAGGPTNMANKKAVFVVRGDGSVVGGKGSGEWFAGDVMSAELRPGDMVFVPEKALGGTPMWKSTMQAAQLMSSIAIAISVGRQF
ncbi:MAG: polysaccharide export protein [Candidatus Sulfotelmatobacter sp.]|nr:polysaccharide export protein [Candidatus Sulfotelmatobacter sp.]